ncbi:MAG TPA: DsbA family oxidoreductase [Bacillota bacterium]|nr:DsbA family oxidoreductase [Bacillota bacterium]
MRIEVWSDFVCPFCYIGKRTLEQALASFPHKNSVIVSYKSYELEPNAEIKPQQNIHEILAHKYKTTVEKVKKANDDIAKRAAALGLTYHFDTMQPTNTFDAHRLVKYAAKHGKGNEMTERLFKAYFTESKLISDHAILIDLALELGFDRQEIAALLDSCRNTSLVRDDEDQAREMGVQGVPFFVFNDTYALSGAQPAEVFTEVIEQVWTEEKQQPQVKRLDPKTSGTTYCTDDGCK